MRALLGVFFIVVVSASAGAQSLFPDMLNGCFPGYCQLPAGGGSGGAPITSNPILLLETGGALLFETLGRILLEGLPGNMLLETNGNLLLETGGLICLQGNTAC